MDSTYTHLKPGTTATEVTGLQPASGRFPRVPMQRNGKNTRSNPVLQAFAGAIGTNVTLVTTADVRYEGVVCSTTNDTSDPCVILEERKDLSTPGVPLKVFFIPVSTISTYSFDPVDVRPAGDHSLPTGPDTLQNIPVQFHEREPQAWRSEDDPPPVPPSTPDNDTLATASGDDAWGRSFDGKQDNTAQYTPSGNPSSPPVPDNLLSFEWIKERNRLVARSEEQARQITTLENELVTLRSELAKQERERWEERAQDIERQDQAQVERENWEENMKSLLAREKEQTTYTMMLEYELAVRERQRDIERQDQAQVEREKLVALERELQELKCLERERSEEREQEKAREDKKQRQAQMEKEKLTRTLHQVLALHLIRPSIMDVLPKRLQGEDAQIVVDYLSATLDCRDILRPKERKRALHLLCKIAKSAQVFPKTIELTGVECDLVRSINEGGFGVIYKGKFQEETVCIKAVRMYGVGARKQALRAHAGELVLGAHALHPNVLPFYGAFISSEPTPRICIASPWMEGGNLVDHLHEHPDTPRILLVSDILSGLQHLHEMSIVHADLKGSNVLISRAQRAMLADFGVSRIAMTSVGTTTTAGAVGTTNWMAPELLTAEVPLPATRESDMWAFGCVCYEILAEKVPFEEYKLAQLIRAFIVANATLPRPDPNPSISYASEIWSLAELCFQYDPNKRPTADDAAKFILDLNVKDERPPAVADPDMFVKRPRSTVEIDYDTLVSIIQSAGEIL